MNDDGYLSDSTMTQELRNALSEVTAPERPPLATITSRGHAHQRRRLAGFAGFGVTGVAAGTALALGLTGVVGATPARSTGTIRTVTFTLTRNANGTDTLTLTNSQMADPATLQKALARDGIPALVKTGTICSSNPAPPSSGVLTIERPDGTPVHPSAHPVNITNDVNVINPAAMPAGTELFIGYLNSGRVHAIHPGLIYTSSYTCSYGGQPPATP